MHLILLVLGLITGFNCQPASRTKPQGAFLLPTDTERYLTKPLKPQFRCLKTGYYADIDNNCQMYHVCVVQTRATGHKVTRQFSFVCGNGTIFNQLTQTCDNPEESLPCIDAPKFYGLNIKVGQADVVFHNGNDYKEGFEKEDTASGEEYFDRDEEPVAMADTIHLSANKPGVYYYTRERKNRNIIFNG